jgi:hypothetical protein
MNTDTILIQELQLIYETACTSEHPDDIEYMNTVKAAAEVLLRYSMTPNQIKSYFDEFIKTKETK